MLALVSANVYSSNYASRIPPDSRPQSWAKPDGDTRGSAEAPRRDGLTLIMACRSTERAEAARKELYQALDAHIAQLRSQRDYDGHADVFRRNLKIEIEYLDLSVLSSVFNFSVQMSKQYVTTWITQATDTEIRIDIRTYRT